MGICDNIEHLWSPKRSLIPLRIAQIEPSGKTRPWDGLRIITVRPSAANQTWHIATSVYVSSPVTESSVSSVLIGFQHAWKQFTVQVPLSKDQRILLEQLVAVWENALVTKDAELVAQWRIDLYHGAVIFVVFPYES